MKALTAGDIVSSSVRIRNTGAEEKNICVVATLYNEDDAMKDICAKHITLDAGAEETVENTVSIPSDADSGWKLKTYVLETLGNIYSYCESFSFPPEPMIETSSGIT